LHWLTQGEASQEKAIFKTLHAKTNNTKAKQNIMQRKE